MTIALFCFLALIAEILGTVGGFGSSMLFVPLASFFFDLKTVLGITAVFHVFSNLSKLVLFYRHIDWRLTLKIGLPSVLLVIFGAWLTTKVYFRYDQIILGIFLLGFSTVLFLKSDFRLPPEVTTSVIGGSFAGFLAGFVGTGGAVRALTMAAFNLEKNLFVGTSAAIDMGVDFSRTIVYAESGYIKEENYLLIAMLFVISVAGSYIGKLLLKRIEQEKFKKIVLGMIFIAGLSVLTKSILSLYKL